MTPTEIEISLRYMDPGTHAVLVYDTLEHKRDVLLQHIKEGVGKEGLVYAYDGEDPDTVRGEMLKRGIDARGLSSNGLLTVTPSEEIYLKEGRMDIDGIIGGFAKLAFGFKERGLGGIRAGADMTPVLRGKRGDELMNYEKRLGKKFFFPGKGICAYNVVALHNSGQLGILLPLFMAHGLVIMTGPNGFAVRQPDAAAREGLKGVMHHVLPGEEIQADGSGFHPVPP